MRQSLKHSGGGGGGIEPMNARLPQMMWIRIGIRSKIRHPLGVGGSMGGEVRMSEPDDALISVARTRGGYRRRAGVFLFRITDASGQSHPAFQSRHCVRRWVRSCPLQEQ